MPNVTEVQALTMLRAACKLLQDVRRGGASLDALADGYRSTVQGDYSKTCLDGLAGVRANVAGALGRTTIRAFLTGPLLTYAQAAGFPERAPELIVRRAYQRLVDTSQTIQTRAINFGPVVAGAANAGNGALLRLTTDENGFDLEAVRAPGSITFRCRDDQNTNGATKHEEVFEVRGAPAGPDALLWDKGADVATTIKALSARNSIVGNPSFSRYGAATQAQAGAPATPLSIANWKAQGALANFSMDVDVIYRGGPGDPTPTSCRFLQNDKLSQPIQDANRTLLVDRPYHNQVALRRRENCDGTFLLRLGATAVSIVLTTLPNDTWTLLGFQSLAGAQNRKKLWPSQIRQQNVQLELELAGRTQGSVYVDDVVCAPMQEVNGVFYALVGGPLPFLVGDSFNVADSVPQDALIQYWLGRGFDDYWPASATPTFGDQ